MTPARKAALQWFHDRGEVYEPWTFIGAPSMTMIRRMLDDRQLSWAPRVGHFLTDKGRLDLHGAAP